LWSVLVFGVHQINKIIIDNNVEFNKLHCLFR